MEREGTCKYIIYPLHHGSEDVIKDLRKDCFEYEDSLLLDTKYGCVSFKVSPFDIYVDNEEYELSEKHMIPFNVEKDGNYEYTYTLTIHEHHTHIGFAFLMPKISFGKNLQHMKSANPDVLIISDDGKTLSAHSFILRIYFDIINDMFSNEGQQEGLYNEEGEYHLSLPIDSNIIENTIDILYSGGCENKDNNSLLDGMQFGSMFSGREFTECCSNSLSIQDDNCIEVFEKAYKVRQTEVQRRAIRILKEKDNLKSICYDLLQKNSELCNSILAFLYFDDTLD